MMAWGGSILTMKMAGSDAAAIKVGISFIIAIDVIILAIVATEYDIKINSGRQIKHLHRPLN